MSCNLCGDPVHVEIDVHVVRDGAFMIVLHHQVLIEKPQRLLPRGRRQADDARVEVLQHLAPQPVDRAMALIDDDDVERFDGHRGVVRDLYRFGRLQVICRFLIELFRQIRLAL